MQNRTVFIVFSIQIYYGFNGVHNKYIGHFLFQLYKCGADSKAGVINVQYDKYSVHIQTKSAGVI